MLLFVENSLPSSSLLPLLKIGMLSDILPSRNEKTAPLPSPNEQRNSRGVSFCSGAVSASHPILHIPERSHTMGILRAECIPPALEAGNGVQGVAEALSRLLRDSPESSRFPHLEPPVCWCVLTGLVRRRNRLGDMGSHHRPSIVGVGRML